MAQSKVDGTVYGVVLNDRYSMEKIGDLSRPPYKGAPVRPVLYVKPANTHAGEGAVVRLPDGEHGVEIGATVGLVMRRAAARLRRDEGSGFLAGMVIAADLSLPHASYYRPAIREKCFDGALPTSEVLPLTDIGAVTLVVEIDGVVRERRTLSDLLREPDALLADVTEFMTLREGDVLLVGVRYGAPVAEAGSRVRIRAAGLGELNFSINAANDNGGRQ